MDFESIPEEGKERYTRTHLKPVMKSLYQQKRIRYNGSFQGSKGSVGAMNDTIGLVSNGHQNEMMQTFNVSVLNNSFQAGAPHRSFTKQPLPHQTINNSPKQSLSPIRGVRGI